MLTGSPLDADDRVYSEPFSHLPPPVQKAINESELFNNRPVRSSRNRTAFKDSRTSAPYTAETEPTKHDLSARPSPEHEPSLEGEGPLTQCSSLGGDGLSPVLPEDKSAEMKGKRIVGISFVPRCTCSYKVSLGDYVLPPDKRMEHLKGIPRCSSAEYTEPYETSKMVNAIRREGGGGGGGGSRKSSPLEDKPTGYSLARSVGPVRTEPSVPLHRTLSEPSGGTPEDDNSAVYDHLVTWKSKESVSPRSPTSPRTRVIAQYEDPWDSRGKQEQFNQICEKADIASRKSQPTSPTSPNKPSKRMDVYEEAWDSNFKQKQLDAKLLEARRASESKPKGRYEYEEPVSTRSTKNSSPVMTRSSQNAEQVYSSNYEQPWDSKQKELEERFSRVGMSMEVPPGSPPPPDFAPPPPPQTYEEAWDIRPHSKIISQMSSTPKAPDHPPPRRTSPQLSQSTTPSLSKSMAEPIDPKLPLDIQKFYHGGITRKVAEDMLRIHKEGSYLVRRSETQKNVFSLSLKGVGGIPMHLRISLSQGEYVLGENSQPFPTVPEMVAYYTRHDLPVQNASHIKLLHPIARP